MLKLWDTVTMLFGNYTHGTGPEGRLRTPVRAVSEVCGRKTAGRIAVAAAVLALSPAFSLAAVSLFSPEDGAAGVSQSPALVAAELAPGASVQYHFQVDTVQTMDSQGGGPQGSFDQSAAQLFASSGAFSGQDSTVTVTGDAYNGVSTATFVFYSNSAKLNPGTQYYWRARAKPAIGVYGAWSGTATFTTGQFAAVSPVNHLAISGGSPYPAAGDGIIRLSGSVKFFCDFGSGVASGAWGFGPLT